MADIHPLVEMVARAMLDATEKGESPEIAAIRAVLTFEPTDGMQIAVLYSDKWVDLKASSEQRMDPMWAYRAMTAALLKEVEDE